MAEQVVSKAYRVLVDAQEKLWAKISFFTRAKDVEFDNGYNAATTLNAIHGITDDLSATSSNQAASIKAVNQLNSNSGGCVFTAEGSGANTKYFIQKGADSASKKPLGSGDIIFDEIALRYWHGTSASSHAVTDITVPVENKTKLHIDHIYGVQTKFSDYGGSMLKIVAGLKGGGTSTLYEKNLLNVTVDESNKDFVLPTNTVSVQFYLSTNNGISTTTIGNTYESRPCYFTNVVISN